MTEQKNIDLVEDIISERTDRFISKVEAAQSGIFNRVSALVKELELDADGKIKKTAKNVKILARIRQNVEREILTDGYKTEVAGVTKQFEAIKGLNDQYYGALVESFNPNRQIYKAYIDDAVRVTTESLAGSGIYTSIAEPVKEIVRQSVFGGDTFSNLIDQLRIELKGVPGERVGSLERYTGQIVNDALSQFDRTYNQQVSADLGLEWIRYAGSAIKTSRPFCEKYHNQYFHVKEFAEMGKDGGKGPEGDSVNRAGFIKGTNGENIFRYGGGYNCRHVIRYVTIERVPKEVIERARKAGHIE
jgi:hypothetical protein